MTLSEMLREKQGDQSLRALARDMGVAVGTAEGWVKGWRIPEIRFIPVLAVYLEKDVEFVVDAVLEQVNSAKGVYLRSLEVSVA